MVGDKTRASSHARPEENIQLPQVYLGFLGVVTGVINTYVV
jgi:hypothetical protein